MRSASVILSLILVLILAFCAFFYTGGTLQASVSSIRASAAEYPEAFASIQSVLSSGTAPQVFSTDLPEDPSGYMLVDISIALTNRGIFDAEWLNVQVAGASGDIAVYSISGDGTDVSKRSTADLNLKLITRAPESAARTISIQYYVYGISRSICVQA